MRRATKSTWFRIVVPFGIYLLVSAVRSSLSRVSDSMEIVKSLVSLILFVTLLILAIGFGAWDGVEKGFSLLQLLVPFVCFLAPTYPFFNDSAFIHGVDYSPLGFGAHYVGAFICARSSRRMQVCNGPIRALKAAIRICPRAQTPLHLGVAFSDVALPVLRRLKTRTIYRHTEELA